MSDANFTPQFDDANVDGNYGSTGGDITVPTFQGIKPFKFWCQKALPLIYDDSLSYYEVLCKVVNYLNNMMTDLNTATGSMAEFGQQFVINQQFLNSMAQKLGENTEELEDYVNDRMQDFLDAYNELQDYVNEYFDNLDVQEEINTKLDEMAEDGTLDTLLEPFARDWLEDKTEELDTEIASQNATLAQQNSTLAQQNGRISVLEGRMDTFSTLPSGSTSANAELVDIRTNFLGETYDNAGDAVRASDLIASGFMSLPPDGSHNDWYLDGGSNAMNSDYNTISIDITKYKGGRIAYIFNSRDTDEDDYLAGLEEPFAKGNSATPDENATRVSMSDYINVAQLKTYTLSSSPHGTRLLFIISVPETETAQYYYLPYTDFAPDSPTDPPQEVEPDNVVYPNFLLYASEWSKTPVDNTLSHAGEAGDAKATGDAINDLTDFENNTVIFSRLNWFNGVWHSGYIGPSGNLTQNSDYDYSDMIPVQNSQFIVTADNIVNARRVNVPVRFLCAYDANQEVLTDYGQQSIPGDTYIDTVGATPITLNSAVKYIRISVYKGSTKYNNVAVSFDITQTNYSSYSSGSYKLIKSVIPTIIKNGALSAFLDGKRVAIFGDSIMHGAGNNSNGVGEILASKYNMTALKYAVSGATMGVRTDDPNYTVDEVHHIAKQVRNAISDNIKPDLIIFNGGTNDIGGEIPIGTISSVYTQPVSENYFADGFETVAFLLMSNFVGIPIIYMRAHNMSSRSYQGQIDYGELGNKIAEKWGIRTVDMYKRMNTQIAAYRTAYLADYTHPNSDGYNKYYIPAIEEFIFNNLMN